MPSLQVVLCSTRPNRIGEPIAQWFMERVAAHGAFTAELVDLKAINLPPMDEPEHPNKRSYHHDHTKAWSAIVSRADAYVFVTPEYNYSGPPALINALDYLFFEWNYKACGFVSYGGVSGGTRSVQHLKSVITSLRMVPLMEMVSVPFAAKLVNEHRVFNPPETQDAAVVRMLDELLKWTNALESLRRPAK